VSNRVLKSNVGWVMGGSFKRATTNSMGTLYRKKYAVQNNLEPGDW
jgi:hypothetical protein